MNFFGKNESLEQSIEKFDSFEKTVWNKFFTERKDVSVNDFVDYVSNHKLLKKVHYQDRWDMYVDIQILMDKFEYSGNLLIVPARQYYEIKKHLKKLCCGIYTGHKRSVINPKRNYCIAFDFGH